MRGFVKKSFLVYFLFLLTTFPYSLEEKAAPLPVPEKTKQPVEQTASAERAASLNEPVPAEQVNQFQGVIPAAIAIPAIGEQAEVIQVGLTENGAMEAPEDIHQIGWFAPGTKPGSAGNAVLAGHVDGKNAPGTFYNLKKLQPGHEIIITGTKGETLVFVVTGKKSYVPEKAPLQHIFGASTAPHLNLITCTGSFNRSTGNYEERLVVYTELAAHKSGVKKQPKETS